MTRRDFIRNSACSSGALLLAEGAAKAADSNNVASVQVPAISDFSALPFFRPVSIISDLKKTVVILRRSFDECYTALKRGSGNLQV